MSIINHPKVIDLLTMTQITIERTQRLEKATWYTEDVWISEDCIFNDDRPSNKLAAFTITENFDYDDNAKYRVNARRQQYTADNKLIYIYPKIATFNTIDECKSFIIEYANEAVSIAIFNDQHLNALEASYR